MAILLRIVLAVCTAILTTQQAQLMAGRAALVPSNTPLPNLGPAAPHGAGLYATYQQSELRAFVGAAPASGSPSVNGQSSAGRNLGPLTDTITADNGRAAWPSVTVGE